MVERTADIQQLLGRRRDWTPIAVKIDTQRFDIARLLELAEQQRWRLVNLGSTGGKVPSNVEPRGALMDVLPTDSIARDLLARGIPVVRLGSLPHPDDAKVPAVMPDDTARGPIAAEHFAQRDFEHVAYVGRKPWAQLEAMYDAFAARAAELGCRCHLYQEAIGKLRSRLEPGADVMPARQEAFTRWLEQLPKPVGLFTFGDPAAALYCQWVIDAGLRVPEDVAVLGAGDNEFVCQSAAVPLSSIAFDHRGYIEAGVALLVQLMAGQTPDANPVMIPPVGIVTRQSTDVLAASDPAVVAALRFMWDHVADDLSVEQIAKAVGVSRRTLERAFQRDIGRGINAEFQRRRMNRACELLQQTDLRVAEIAEALSFNSSIYFNQAFRAAHGMSPGAWRRRNRPDGNH